jgi:hypothetical protein
MNIFKGLFSLFGGKKDVEIRENPDLILYLPNDRKHALYVCNPDGFTDDIRKNRRMYHAYARDIDDNWEEEMLEEVLMRREDLISHLNFEITIGKGEELSAYRTIKFILPKDVEDLPKSLQPLFAPYLMGVKADLDLLDLHSKIDKEKVIKFKKSLSVMHGAMDEYMGEQKRVEREEQEKRQQRMQAQQQRYGY